MKAFGYKRSVLTALDFQKNTNMGSENKLLTGGRRAIIF